MSSDGGEILRCFFGRMYVRFCFLVFHELKSFRLVDMLLRLSNRAGVKFTTLKREMWWECVFP